MYLGRYQLGQTLDLSVQCKDANGAPVVPDDCPQLQVWSTSGRVMAKQSPVLDRYSKTGLFSYRLFLGNTPDNLTFAPGQYSYVYFWASGTYAGMDVGNFEILPGGSKDGAVSSLYYYQRPQATFLVKGFENGNIAAGRNPRV